MIPAQSSVLRVVTVVLVVGVLVMAGAILRYIVVNAGDDTPRTELERAIFAAEEAVRANPEDATARIKLAAAYLEQGAVNSAVEQADIAARLAPEDPAAHYIKGLAASRSGDYDKAIESLDKAVHMEGQLAGFYQDGYAALARAFVGDGQDEQAIDAMSKAIDLGPENALLLYERGQMYEDQGKLADAVYDYVLALNYDPAFSAAREAYDAILAESPEAVAEAREHFELDRIPEEMSGGQLPEGMEDGDAGSDSEN